MYSFKRFLSLLSPLLQCLVNQVQSSPQLCLRGSTFLQYQRSTRVTNQKDSYLFLFKAAHYLFLMVACGRAIYHNYYLTHGGTAERLLPYDPIVSILSSKYPHLINQYSSSLIGLVAICILHLDYLFFFKVDPKFIKLASELKLESVQGCVNQEGAVGAFPVYSRRFRAFLRQDRTRGVHFTGPPLRHFPHLSKKLRLHLVQQVLISDTAIGACNLLSGMAWLYIWAFHLVTVWREVPLLCLPHTTLDLTFLFYSIFNGVRLALFASAFFHVLKCFSTGYLAELSCSICRRLALYQVKSTTIRRYTLERQIRRLTSAHTFLLATVEYMNKKLISDSLIVVYLTNILANIVVLNILLLKEMNAYEQGSIVFIIGIQVLVSLENISLLVAVSESLYGWERPLYRAQGALKVSVTGRQQDLSGKLHLLTFYEVLCTKEPFTFTVGALAKVSKPVLFEFLFAYSGFFIYVAKFLRKRKLEI